ncbi:MAG: hypothetical protein J3Q66DRAFT_410753 [Benniella sp.]|nr:MAG: hypothetical protein J3Q66DRAFT_410753 [Benniella sp.]
MAFDQTSPSLNVRSRTVLIFRHPVQAHVINPTLAAPTEKSKKHSLKVTLSSSSSPTSPISPFRHIRRWTSNLSSSKASRKSNKIRAVSPISAPQPLKTPVPFACTPLPYSGSSTATTSPIATTPPGLLGPPSPSRPAYSSLSRSHHTSWKSRLFRSTGKKHDKRARTHSSMEDDTVDMNNRINAKLKNKTTKQTTSRPKMHISIPLTQPTLPPSQKTVPIPSPSMSSPGDMFGPASKRKPDNARKRQSTSDSIRSILDALIMIATTTAPGEIPQTQVHEEHGTTEATVVSTTKSLKDRRDQVSTSVNSVCKELKTDVVSPSLSLGQLPQSSSTGKLRPQTKVVPEITPRSSSIFTTSDSFATSRTRKSGGIKVPSSFMTLLPTNIGKDKTSSVGPLITPPPTPPLDQKLEVMLNDPMAKFPTKPDLATDPRALTIKRMAFIHTMKKLRERGRRPFRHVVLMHHTLLQLRRGVTPYQFEEIENFYAAMWTTQFPARVDKASTMASSQGQNFPHHQQALMREHHSNTNDTLQPSSAQQTGKNAGATQGGKNSKAKPPPVSSFQSRVQSSMVQTSGSGESCYSGDDHKSSGDSETTSASTIPCPSPQRATQPLPSKKELSSASTSSSPSTETEGKSVFDVASTVRRSPPPVSSDSDYGDATTGKRAVHLPLQSMVIIPKRTTGRKGLIYQQQQQLQLQLQEQLQGENVPSGILPDSIASSASWNAISVCDFDLYDGYDQGFRAENQATCSTLHSELSGSHRLSTWRSRELFNMPDRFSEWGPPSSPSKNEVVCFASGSTNTPNSHERFRESRRASTTPVTTFSSTLGHAVHDVSSDDRFNARP